MFGRKTIEPKEDICRDCTSIATDQDNRRFQCRRFPPLRFKDEGGRLHTDFPPVDPNDWCGEFQRNSSGRMRRHRSEYGDRY
jgi:hypothetical protein